MQRDAGIPHFYYALLVHLSEAPGRRLRMTDLAEQVKITRSRLSHAVARLEEQGWVSRADCDTDKRSNGCEINTTSDVSNCSGCGVVCSINNISRACSGSRSA